MPKIRLVLPTSPWYDSDFTQWYEVCKNGILTVQGYSRSWGMAAGATLGLAGVLYNIRYVRHFYNIKPSKIGTMSTAKTIFLCPVLFFYFCIAITI